MTGSPGSPITGFRPLPGGGGANGWAPGVGSDSITPPTALRARNASVVASARRSPEAQEVVRDFEAAMTFTASSPIGSARAPGGCG